MWTLKTVEFCLAERWEEKRKRRQDDTTNNLCTVLKSAFPALPCLKISCSCAKALLTTSFVSRGQTWKSKDIYPWLCGWGWKPAWLSWCWMKPNTTGTVGRRLTPMEISRCRYEACVQQPSLWSGDLVCQIKKSASIFLLMSLTLYSKRDIREILFIVVISAVVVMSTTTAVITKIRMLLVGQVARC